MLSIPRKPKLLIVDDDEGIRSQMKWALTEDFEIFVAADRDAASDIFRQQRPPAVLLDLGLPPRPNEPDEGLLALDEMLAADQLAKIIVITGQGEKANAIRAVGKGAYDLLCKPADLEHLKVILKRALYVGQLERDYREMHRHLGEDAFEGMLAASPQMQQVFAIVRKVATTSAPVLILGESGTGKEMVAQAIHRRSARKEGAFVAINCGAIPENLLESELFGHEKGSFTGAHTQRKGRIETAAGGTLFLDEIGELPLQLQVKLLRFLQEQTIERIGGRVQIQVDVRVVAATNIDLKQAMSEGKFREDLFYRLAVVVIRLPALRERSGDILHLARAFLKRAGAQSASAPREFSAPAGSALEQHRWPGNVRELENRVRRAVIMAEGRFITPADLELESSAVAARPSRSLKEARENLEREMVLDALQKHSGKITSAAAALGISRPTLYELMEKLGVQRGERDRE
jgi:two-component system, NtrC family, response regulator